MALIPEKALPSASFCRQRYSRNQPDCLLPSSPSRLPLGCSRYITAGGYWLSKAMAAPSSVPFPLKQKLFSLATVHHIYNSLLIKARSTFKAERKPCSPSLCELVFQQKALVLQSQFFCVRHCAFTNLPPPTHPPHCAPPPPHSITLRHEKAMTLVWRCRASWTCCHRLLGALFISHTSAHQNYPYLYRVDSF